MRLSWATCSHFLASPRPEPALWCPTVRWEAVTSLAPSGKRLLHQPLATRASHHLFLLGPSAPISALRSGLHHLPLCASPLSPQAGEAWSSLPDFLEQLQPCGLIWGPKWQSLLCVLLTCFLSSCGCSWTTFPSCSCGRAWPYDRVLVTGSMSEDVPCPAGSPKSPTRSSTLSIPPYTGPGAGPPVKGTEAL